MAITSAATMKEALEAAAPVTTYHAAVSANAGMLMWPWISAVSYVPGALTVLNATTGVAFDLNTVGAMPFPGMGGADPIYLAQMNIHAGSGVIVYLYDILYGAGPIATSVAQTTTFTDQPTTWQERVYGDFKDVEMFYLQIVAQGSYATTVTASYVNENGVSGRVATQPISLTSSSVARMYQFCLDTGDCGVQQVDSITVAGTLSVTGTCGVLLLRKICQMQFPGLSLVGIPLDPMTTNLPKIHPNSCLCPFARPLGVNPLVYGQYGFVK